MDMDAYGDVFREEAKELLTDLETALLELEETPNDMDLVGRAFRALHTIKGSGAMFGFDAIATFTHKVESVFDRVRDGKLDISKTLIDLSLDAKDHIRALLNNSGEAPEALEAHGREVLSKLEALTEKKSGDEGSSNIAPDPAGKTAEKSSSKKYLATYRIRLCLNSNNRNVASDPSPLIEQLRQLGECKTFEYKSDTSTAYETGEASKNTGWDVILTTDKGMDAVQGVFILIDDAWDIKINIVDGDDFPAEENALRLGDILIERGDVTQESINKCLAPRKRIGEVLTEAGCISPDKVESALAEQNIVKKEREKRLSIEAASNMRVAASKLDILVDLVGELVISQARLTQLAGNREDAELLSVAEEVERLTTELRDNTLGIRMLPIGTTFSRFKRLVRDLSGQLNKEVELITNGGETELDKTVIDRLGDPLVHLIRNCIDHGIETPDLRQSRGKPRTGTVTVSAKHSAANVVIQISDDGAGLDVNAIKRKALEKGLITTENDLPEDAIFNLIFSAGFSTAEIVTDVSGRGVGMDVVKRSIEALRGSISISSKQGRGTSITIKLPLTLAIIEGLLVKAGEESFVAPLSVVEECIELTREDVIKSHGNTLAKVRGELVPYIRLRDWFGEENSNTPPVEQVVITNLEGSRFGLVVDQVVGQQQTVIKNLGKMYQGIEGLSGATILGDGKVALILDVPRLMASTEATAAETQH